MRVATRADLAPLAGKREIAPVAAPEVKAAHAVSAAPAPDTAAGIVEASRQMVIAAHMMVDAVHQIAQPAKPKQLEAIIVRDGAGKMSKVIINVV